MVFDTIEINLVFAYLHEREAFQRSAFGWSTAGNDVVATIIIRVFFPVFFSPPSRPFLIEGVIGTKNLAVIANKSMGFDPKLIKIVL